MNPGPKVFALCIVAGLSAIPSCAQNTFEVASVRVLQNGGPLPGCCSDAPVPSGTRLRWITTASLMLRYAWDLPQWRLFGKIPETIYEVNAETAAPANENQLRKMFQDLLATRLRAEVHHETRDRDGFILTRAGKETKLHPHNAADDPAPLPPWFAFMGDDGVKRLDGTCRISLENGLRALTCRNVPVSRLATQLENHLHTFVIDQTGLSGNYYFAFLFARDDLTANADAPDLFTAIRNELGLRLEKQKAPVDMLVVEAIASEPTAN